MIQRASLRIFMEILQFYFSVAVVFYLRHYTFCESGQQKGFFHKFASEDEP